jgi:hypothetical protein
MTLATRSSCDPAPIWLCSSPDGPHSIGGGAGVSEGLGFRELLFLLHGRARVLLLSLPRTLVAKPWIAENELLHAPEMVLYGLPSSGMREVVDLEGDPRTEVWPLEGRLGDKSISGRSCRSDLRRRVLGRNVEFRVVLLDGDADDGCIGASRRLPPRRMRG